MQYVVLILIAAAVFGLCYLVDKGFARVFRGKAQHRSGLAVRANKRYALVGLALLVLGAAAIFRGNTALTIGGILVLLLGICLTVYYLSFGIFYDAETLLLAGFGRKDRVYRFCDIAGQKLYLIQGGTVVVELHLKDGSAFSVQTGTMEGAYPFLDHAFAAWCRQKAIVPESCEFHDPANSLWFPTVEEK